MKKNKTLFKNKKTPIIIDNDFNQEIWAYMPILISFVKFTNILKEIRKEIKEEENSKSSQ